jgi:uncharacterized protein YndB with AHSA1/START domain
MIEPIRRSITVARPPEHAFRVFTEGLTTWWPSDRFSRAADGEFGDGVKVERLVFEGRVGGRVYEVTSDGREASWAEVLVFDPPSRVVLAWKPNATDQPPTEVEVTFTREGDATRVDLEHRGWERLGDVATQGREQYAQGWPLVFDGAYGEAAGAADGD